MVYGLSLSLVSNNHREALKIKKKSVIHRQSSDSMGDVTETRVRNQMGRCAWQPENIHYWLLTITIYHGLLNAFNVFVHHIHTIARLLGIDTSKQTLWAVWVHQSEVGMRIGGLFPAIWFRHRYRQDIENKIITIKLLILWIWVVFTIYCTNKINQFFSWNLIN